MLGQMAFFVPGEWEHVRKPPNGVWGMLLLDVFDVFHAFFPIHN